MTAPTFQELLLSYRSKDGGLNSLSVHYTKQGEYISWSPASERVNLDGDFTAEELRVIADYIEKNYGKDSGART